ncbi:MAG: hypothetical protein KC476_10655, partial [Cyanobacteria bacterium HKST-UBA06]|nr:hypothetical protein [Cyanobacteria bacterium HKST-UBA06]
LQQTNNPAAVAGSAGTTSSQPMGASSGSQAGTSAGTQAGSAPWGAVSVPVPAPAPPPAVPTLMAGNTDYAVQFSTGGNDTALVFQGGTLNHWIGGTTLPQSLLAHLMTHFQSTNNPDAVALYGDFQAHFGAIDTNGNQTLEINEIQALTMMDGQAMLTHRDFEALGATVSATQIPTIPATTPVSSASVPVTVPTQPTAPASVSMPAVTAPGMQAEPNPAVSMPTIPTLATAPAPPAAASAYVEQPPPQQATAYQAPVTAPPLQAVAAPTPAPAPAPAAAVAVPTPAPAPVPAAAPAVQAPIEAPAEQPAEQPVQRVTAYQAPVTVPGLQAVAAPTPESIPAPSPSVHLDTRALLGLGAQSTATAAQVVTTASPEPSQSSNTGPNEDNTTQTLMLIAQLLMNQAKPQQPAISGSSESENHKNQTTSVSPAFNPQTLRALMVFMFLMGMMQRSAS